MLAEIGIYFELAAADEAASILDGALDEVTEALVFAAFNDVADAAVEALCFFAGALPLPDSAAGFACSGKYSGPGSPQPDKQKMPMQKLDIMQRDTFFMQAILYPAREN